MKDQAGRTKLIKLLNLSTSPNDHEALSAIRMANQMLKNNNILWNQVFESVDIHDEMREIKDIALNQVMPFGKYKGYTVGEILNQDLDYLDWCLRNIDRNPRLLDAIRVALGER